MSSKTKTTATKEEAKPTLVPKLRFPEFRGAEEWEQKEVGEVFQVTRGDVLSMTLVNDEKTDAMPFPVYSSQTKNKGLSGYYSDYLFEDAITWTTDGANAGDVNFRTGKFFCTNVCGVLLNSHGFANPCVAALINRVSAKYVSYVGNPKLMNGVMSKIPIPFPPIPEQQKIAECLSSVDELIAAQARKLDALKTHKKGLMQQLFPREGETQPRLRFPEFQNAGEWEVRTIGEMFSLINGCAFKPEDWKPTGTPIIRIQNLNDPSAEFNYSQAPVPERNRVESGNLLFAWSGTLGSSFGARIWNGPSGVLNQHIFKVLMDEQQITLRFALLVLARVEEEIARRTHGFKASFVHVKKADLVQVEMLLPSVPEQQCIATCLSSLDALITAATQKHEALKTHKKGLMQQLFPSQGEVEA